MQDTQLVVPPNSGVLDNDSGNGIVVASHDAMSAAGGAVQINPNGRVRYTPPAGFWRDDTFDYTIEDPVARQDSATVTVTVAPVLANMSFIESETTGGFAINGEATGSMIRVASFPGRMVGRAGDVDGDGLDDVIVGAPYANGTGGRSYVVFGKTDMAAVSLSEVALADAMPGGDGGFAIDGDGLAYSGWSVRGAGDVNDDGYDDVIVGTEWDYSAALQSGRAYVVFGKADGDPVSLTTIAGGGSGDGFLIESFAPYQHVGVDVAAAGDVNLDGYADVVVGSLWADYNGGEYQGRTYVVFGKDDSDTVLLSAVADTVTPAGGFIIDGAQATDWAGFSVSGVGDVNGDNRGDIVIGAREDDSRGVNAGRAYVVFGKNSTAAVDLAALGSQGFIIEAEAAGDVVGAAVGGGGDVDNDGTPDIVVGAFGASGATGRAYVVFGKGTTSTVDLASLGGDGFAINGSTVMQAAGYSVSIATDIDGDGMDDVIVGEPFVTSVSRRGRAHLVYGKATTTAVSLASVTMGMGGFSLDAASDLDRFGFSVDGAGDVDGDGFGDLVVGAPRADPGPDNAGTVYVFCGGDFR